MVQADDFKHVRDIVEVIEERLPGGKWWVRIVLGLLLAMVGVWAFLYLWSKAVVPLGHILTALITGTSLNLHITIEDVVVVVSGVATGGLISRWIGRYSRRVFTHIGRLHAGIDVLTERLEKLTQKDLLL